MTRTELVSRVANKAGLTKRAADAVVEEVVVAVAEALRSGGGPVRVHGLGIFEVVQRAAKVGRNPRTGERVDIPAGKAVRFRAARGLRNSVARGRRESVA